MLKNKSTNAKTVGIILSLILHLLILIQIIDKKRLDKLSNPEINLQTVAVSILNKEYSVVDNLQGNIPLISAESDKLICSTTDKDYLGIGIFHGTRGIDIII